MTFAGLVLFRRMSTAVMVVVMTAFLVSAVVGAVRCRYGCGSSGRTVKCAGEYTVDGFEHASEMPVRSAPSGRKVDIEVLAADHSAVISKSWLDVLFFRGVGSLSRHSRSGAACGGFAWHVRQPPNFIGEARRRFTRSGRIHQ